MAPNRPRPFAAAVVAVLLVLAAIVAVRAFDSEGDGRAQGPGTDTGRPRAGEASTSESSTLRSRDSSDLLREVADGQVRAMVLRVRVQRLSGDPVVGSELTVSSKSGALLFEGRATDEATVIDVPTGAVDTDLVVEAVERRGFGPEVRAKSVVDGERLVSSGHADVTLTLPEALRYAGLVTSPRGRPLQDVLVFAVAITETGFVSRAAGKSDGSGNFQFGLDDGAVPDEIAFFHEDYAVARLRCVEVTDGFAEVVMAEEAETWVDIRTATGEEVHSGHLEASVVRYVDGVLGEVGPPFGLDGVTMTKEVTSDLTELGRSALRVGQNGDDVRLKISRVNGDYVSGISADHPGRVAVERNQAIFTVMDGGRISLTVELVRALTITCRIRVASTSPLDRVRRWRVVAVDERGDPIPGRGVIARTSPGDPGFVTLTARLGPQFRDIARRLRFQAQGKIGDDGRLPTLYLTPVLDTSTYPITDGSIDAGDFSW